jgi:prepilin-type N-terminal cleavage/methylation domain-containing protein
MKNARTRNVGWRSQGGFTLVEVLVCAVLLVIGFLALVGAYGHESVVTQRSEDVTTGAYLADEIRDMALQMAFGDVVDLNGTTFSPARLSTGAAQDFAWWSQSITVSPVSGTNLNQVVPEASAGAARVAVQVRSHGTPVVTQTYYIFKMDGVPFTDGN